MKKTIKAHTFNILKEDMVSFFTNRPERDSTVYMRAKSWPRFVQSEYILSNGYVPCLIWKYGKPRKVIVEKSEMNRIAFDDGPYAHVSYLFQGRLIKVIVDEEIEEQVVVSYFKSHNVNKEIFFVKMARHVEDQVSEVPVPFTLVGIWGCPAHSKRAQIHLVRATIDLLCVGAIPPPIMIDCSKLDYTPPYNAVTLHDIVPLLPQDGNTIISPEYGSDLKKHEVVLVYENSSVQEARFGPDYKDPNFYATNDKMMHLTYSGYWPKQ